jgi:hypothetical protein
VLHNGRQRCAGTRETRCRIGGLTYDGRTHGFSVRAANARGLRSPLSGTTRWRAIGNPQGFGQFNATTPQQGRAQVKFRVPHSRGARNTISLRVNGVHRHDRDMKHREGDVVTWDYFNPDHDAAYSVQLRVCNEDRRCTSSPVDHTWTWGGLGRGARVDVRDRVLHKQDRIGWNITVDTNGRNAKLVVVREVWRGDERKRSRRDVYNIGTRDVRTMTLPRLKRNPGAHERMWFRLRDPVRDRTSPRFPGSGKYRSGELR